MANAISGATTFPISRASYYFAGPDSPANRQYPLFDVEGIDSLGAIVGAPWSVFSNIYLGTPAVGVATYVVNAQAIAGAVNAPLNASNESIVSGLNGGVKLVVMDVPRVLAYKSSNGGDTTQTVTSFGYDTYKMAMTETITLNGTTVVNGLKAFKYVWKVHTSASMAGNLSVGSSGILGMPVAIDAGGLVGTMKVVSGVQSTDAGSFVFADRTATATALTGDVRGTYAPAATLNSATTGIYVQCFPAMGPHLKVTSTYGVQQF